MVELVDTRDLEIIIFIILSALIRKFRSRISLIKQLNKVETPIRLENGIIPSNRYNELSCDRSLTYGDIGFGDDELN